MRGLFLGTILAIVWGVFDGEIRKCVWEKLGQTSRYSKVEFKDDKKLYFKVVDTIGWNPKHKITWQWKSGYNPQETYQCSLEI